MIEGAVDVVSFELGWFGVEAEAIFTYIEYLNILNMPRIGTIIPSIYQIRPNQYPFNRLELSQLEMQLQLARRKPVVRVIVGMHMCHIHGLFSALLFCYFFAGFLDLRECQPAVVAVVLTLIMDVVFVAGLSSGL